jgi:HEAT repeat protein
MNPKFRAFRNLIWFWGVGVLSLIACHSSVAQDQPQRSEADLIAVLKSEAPAADKAMACKFLAVRGTAAAVPELERLLPDEQLASWSRIALEAIPGAEADAALRRAAEQLQGQLLVGVVNSIGVRRDVKAVELLTARLGDGDRDVASAACAALGRIGGEASAQALRRALDGGPAELRSSVAEGCILCAERFLSDGQAARAIDLYDAIRNADVDGQKRLEATRGAILARGEAGIPLLLENLLSDDRRMFQMALGTAREMPGAAVVEAVASQIPKCDPARAELLISVLADRASPGTLPALLQAAGKGPKAVRMAAIAALGRVGDATCVPTLLEMGLDSDTDLSAAAKSALAALPDESVGQVIVVGLPKAEGKRYVMLLELVGQRRIPAIEQLSAALEHRDATVRRAALVALGNTVPPERLQLLIDRAADSRNAADHPIAIQALKTAAVRMPDRERCAEQLAAAMEKSPSAAKAELLEILGAVGGTRALQTIAAAAKTDDGQLQDLSTRLLGEWMTVDVAPVLLDLSQSAPSAKYQVRALRGYIRVARQFTMNDDERMEMCRQAFGAAKQPAEQKLVLDVLKRYPSPKALKLAIDAISIAELKDDATQVALAIAPKLSGGAQETKELLAKIGLGKVKLEIIKAEYGAGTTQRDVTAIVRQAAADSPLLSLPSSSYNEAFGGDPLPGTRKELRIEYRLNGKPATAIFEENTVLILPSPK